MTGKEPKKLATFRLPAWMLDKLRNIDSGESQAEAIEDALKSHRGWVEPSSER